VIRLTVPGKPVKSNDRMHWRAEYAAKRRVAADATYAALSTWGLKPPPLTFPVVVTVEDHCRTANLRDTEAVAPSVKFILDALTRYGLWPDDRSEFVAEIRYLPPVKTGTDEIVITITPSDSTGSAAVALQERSVAEKRTQAAPPPRKKAK
jgi:hypothetical protein